MAKSTFLQLCQAARLECEIPGTGPSAVTGQTGILALLVSHVAKAVKELERMYEDWDFMWTQASNALVASQYDYDPVSDWGITDLRTFRPETFRIYKTTDGIAYQQELEWWDWEDWNANFGTAFSASTEGYPGRVTRLPNGNFRFDAIPDTGYTVTFDYSLQTTDMADDSDTSNIPEEYEDIVVYSTMIKYGKRQGMPGIEDDGLDSYNELLSAMERELLPTVKTPGPLA